MKMIPRSIPILAALLVMATAEGDWTSQCDKCKCMWSNGRKNADCKNLALSSIPTTLSAEIRDIDFSGNSFSKLWPQTFLKAKLENIHKLKLQNCGIYDMDSTAFKGLVLLIELDLSSNSISKLDRKIFRDNMKLRVLSLNNNNITVLEDGLFFNMTHLQQVFLDNNKIISISPHVFEENPALKHIALANNQIKYMDYDFTESFGKLSSLSLEGNPWVCDCRLEKFRNASLVKNLVTTGIVCHQPDRVKGREWSDNTVIFSCSPVIVEPEPNKVYEVDSGNYTLTCKVIGSPRPDIDWKTNGRIVDRDPRQSVQKYFTAREYNGNYTVSHLTIINVSYRDRGEYKCVAKNPGGEDERNVSLVVHGSDAGVFGNHSPLGNDMLLIIILSVGAIILLIIILVLVICCCKRTRRDNAVLSKNRGIHQSSEFINMDGHPEMQKALITDVNPVVKPPRQYSVPPSVTSGGTEVSEAKKMLIDEESIITGDDESRSFDFDPRLPLKSQNHLDIDYHSDHRYPPDLLSFPPRAVAQVSPAGSSASTVADTTRLPAHHGPQSPIHSPLYDTTSLYRTLPYSRSQSPFTSPLGAPIRVPRQGGYVTIPRRPRQSWSASSEPPQTTETGEPLYDNLGLRTTAQGSSVLSLNKLGTGEPTTPSPRTPRPIIYNAMTPVSLPCDPIAEHDSPPIAATLPRSASAHRALSPSADIIRQNWTRSPEQPDSRRESTASLLPTPDGKTPKIPPRPPPKPKKRTSTGPLFEDEGEDGTEV